MSTFEDFKNAVSKRMTELENTGLLYTDTEKDDLWDTYLNSFPEGSDPIYKERTEHDCQCCKQFIRSCGSVVTIVNGAVSSIWDISIGGDYQDVADALSTLVRSNPIKNKYLHFESSLGTHHNHQQLEDGGIKTWEHFHHELAPAYVADQDRIDSDLGKHRTSVQTFKRALDEISMDALQTVLDLIGQNSLYRGQEHEESLRKFFEHKSIYDILSDESKELYQWSLYDRSVAGIRNSSIGTLLVNLSEGKELDYAVSAFEKMVAPSNYKRPNALITRGMIDKAEKKVEELGIKDSLQRRYAVMDDLTINNVIYANRNTKRTMGVFEAMRETIAVDTKNLSNVEEVDIKTFIDSILPTATSIEMFLANKHTNNLFSLIAPVVEESRNILKWGNNFSWSYNGEVTDSMKERVKAKGGNIDAELRFSIQWNEDNDNRDDLDAHCQEPCNNLIYFSNKGQKHRSSGMLDVDIVSPGNKVAVENITWVDRKSMPAGDYEMIVHCYGKSGGTSGFTAQIEFDGVIHDFAYDKALKPNQKVKVASVSFDGINFTIKPTLKSSAMAKEVWGINTHQFHNVSMVMNSPNHWDGESTGNKHYMFVLDHCKNENQSRGFYNEFLSNELHENRKVFEVLGSKLKTEKSDNQLSGLGFSETKRDSVLCRVSGSFDRIVKINF